MIITKNTLSQIYFKDKKSKTAFQWHRINNKIGIVACLTVLSVHLLKETILTK